MSHRMGVPAQTSPAALCQFFGQFGCRTIDLANPVYNGPIVVSADADHFELLR